MTRVEKVTVSLPSDLAACIERRRTESGESRSEVVTDLCWRGWWQWDEEQRLHRSEEAYAARPETGGEQASAEAAADLMADWDAWDGPEAKAVIEEERADVLARLRRLVAEPGASAFSAAVRSLLKGKRTSRAAG
jgi:hypothetical protein